MLSIDKDKTKESIFINDSITLWDEIKSDLKKITKKINDTWNDKLKEENKKTKK